MQVIYSKKFYIGLDKIGFDKKITLKYIMNMFQQCATANAEELGFGYKQLSPLGQAWVINKIKVQLINDVKAGDEITFYTWPITPKHFTCERDFEGFNERGEKVFVGTSLWNIIDLEKRSLFSTDQIKQIPVDYPTKRALEEKDVVRFNLDETFEKKYIKEVKISDLDLNDHVNNTNYVTYSIDCMTKQDYALGFRTFEIKFHQELKFGDQVELYYKKEDKNHYVIGKKSGEDKVFSCRLENN